MTRSVVAHSPHDVIAALAISPVFDQDQALFIATSATLRKTSDGGYSWRVVENGLDNKSLFTDIAISPSYSADGTIFVSSEGDGIYKSENEGLSWSKVNSGLTDLNISMLEISPDYENDQTLLAVSNNGGLFLSEDEAKTWVRVIDDKIKISALAFLPRGEQQQVLSGDMEGNIYLSERAGADWRRIDANGFGSAITAIAVSPDIAVDGTVFYRHQGTLNFQIDRWRGRHLKFQTKA